VPRRLCAISLSCHVDFAPSRRATSAFVPRRLCAISASCEVGFGPSRRRATSASRHVGLRHLGSRHSASRHSSSRHSSSRHLGFAHLRPPALAPAPPPPRLRARRRLGCTRGNAASASSVPRMPRFRPPANSVPARAKQRPSRTAAVANLGLAANFGPRELRPPAQANSGTQGGADCGCHPGRLRLLGEQPRAAAPRVWPPISRRPGPTPRAFSTSQRGGKIAHSQARDLTPALGKPHSSLPASSPPKRRRTASFAHPTLSIGGVSARVSRPLLDQVGVPSRTPLSPRSGDIRAVRVWVPHDPSTLDLGLRPRCESSATCESRAARKPEKARKLRENFHRSASSLAG
jgi:hypothetical protein